MEALHNKVETWIRDQTSKIVKVSWGPFQWRITRWWPPWNSITEQRLQRKRIQQEYQRRKKQLQDLCRALKVESVSDLQEILCCMVLSECVYKRPVAELVRAVNRFKADFGGHIVSLERVQPSADHVPHRYLLAEAGDTLFASFIGTKRYKDVVTDANILQGAIFHDEVEVVDGSDAAESQESQSSLHSLETKVKQPKDISKPAAHRGFMARAKGIPALELYRLAQKKKRKLVLCGHSLGGAVAVLATLAILRVISATSSKDNEKVPVKCITFSQPPVGNAALRDYVNTRGWQQYFNSYCIPEDLVPRILSPAYFHHYNAQVPLVPNESETHTLSKSVGVIEKSKKDSEGEQLVLGLGPVQRSFWRLSRLVPLEGVKKQLNKYRGKHVDSIEASGNSSLASEDEAMEPQSLEIQEGSDGISLKPLPDADKSITDMAVAGKLTEKNKKSGNNRTWRPMPSLPSYVPFGQLYLLGTSSVESLSGAEYSKLTSVRSVIAELKERFQSHSMKSYRSRFLRIYELCMCDNASTFLGMEPLQQFPHLQQWLGRAATGKVELGHIVEDPVIRSATSIVPLGWSGNLDERNQEPFKVDITGFGLHLCTLVHAQVNGTWCSTTVENFPSTPPYSANYDEQHELQKMRVLVGAPLKRPPLHQIVAQPLMPGFSSINSENNLQNSGSSCEINVKSPDDPVDLNIFCTSDFTTVSKEVHLRTRRVRLLGLEGAGKTSLYKAITGQGKIGPIANIESILPEPDVKEGIAGGICYSDSVGVNLQELNLETSRFRDELWMGICDIGRKIDLIVLVHNLSHRIPLCNSSNGTEKKPALSLLLNEAKALGIPWILAITNKFSVSAHQQKASIDAVLKEYQASPLNTEVVNSCPYVVPGTATASLPWSTDTGNSDGRIGAQKLIFAPINLMRMPFQRKDTVFPVEGVDALCQLVHRVLRSQEEASLQEFAKDRLLAELAGSITADSIRDSKGKGSLSAATVGASVGAGIGLVLAVVMGAASALRKP